jgi:parvulin-like peptidyl-prolyl isomerase
MAGDIGYFTYKGGVRPDFAKAAFSLKNGELSDVVSTTVGVHLIVVTERQEGKASRFEEVQATVREIAMDEELLPPLLTKYRKTCEIKVHLP